MNAINEGARELSLSTERSGANDVLVAVRDSGRALIQNVASASTFSTLSTRRSPAESA
jgi:hypothetical protein